MYTIVGNDRYDHCRQNDWYYDLRSNNCLRDKNRKIIITMIMPSMIESLTVIIKESSSSPLIRRCHIT